MQNVLELSEDAHIVYDRLGYVPGKRMISEFVIGIKDADYPDGRRPCLSWPASRVRRAIAELYGFGMVKVDSIDDGQEVWVRTSPTDMLVL